MGFMNAWEKWSQKQWDTWGVKLQPKYDEIKAWKLTDKQNAALAAILAALPNVVQVLLSRILNYMREVIQKKGGTEAVVSAAENLANFLGTFAKSLKK